MQKYFLSYFGANENFKSPSEIKWPLDEAEMKYNKFDF